MDEAVRAFWSFVHDVPMTVACFQMKRGEDLIRQWYGVARAVCARDALSRQQKIVFGRRYPLTTTLEADESVFGKFHTVVDGRQVFWSWVLVGVITRGDPAGLWLEEQELTKTEDKSRVAPLEKHKWVSIADRLFIADSH